MREYLKDNTRALAFVAGANKALTILGYVAYPLLLVLLFFMAPWLLIRCIIIPAAAFLAVTVVRYFYNAPRPYENGGPAPLINKTTKGKSFPSRHTFCMFMIAFTWMVWMPWAGIVLCVLSVCMATARVALGVHFARDVIAAAIFAGVCALIGYVLIPW